MMKRNLETTGNALVDAMLANRGYSDRKLSAKEFDVESIRAWHGKLDALHSACYEVAVKCYNNESNVDYAEVYSAIRPLYDIIGEVNGAKLRSDFRVATVLTTKAVADKNVNSSDLNYELSRKRLASSRLKELEETNGTCEETKEKLRNEIEEIEAKIDELKKEYGHKTKQYRKVSASNFYKAVEDFIADRLEERLAMTEAEVQAEAQKIKEARKKKSAENKKRKDAEKKAAESALTAC